MATPQRTSNHDVVLNYADDINRIRRRRPVPEVRPQPSSSVPRLDVGRPRPPVVRSSSLSPPPSVRRPVERDAAPGPDNSPRLVVVRSNLDRSQRQTLLLNPTTSQQFADVLRDITDMLKIRHPPVTALYAAHEPFTKVLSIQHWLQCLEDETEYLACGREKVPLELTGRPPPPPSTVRAAPVDSSPKTLRQDTELRPRQQEGRQKNPTVNAIEPVLEDSATATEPPSVVVNVQVYDDPSTDRQHDPNPTRPKAKNNPLHAAPAPYRKITQPEEVVRVYIHGVQREFFAPRFDAADGENRKPDEKLRLHWVYGYQGREAHNNLHLLATGELVYFLSCVVIVADSQLLKQRHYAEHTESITCLAVHPDPNQPYVATGQQAGQEVTSKAHIRIWDSRTLTTVVTFGDDVFQSAVISVCFSGGQGRNGGAVGEYIVAVDDSYRHSLTVWNWRNRQVVAKASTSTDAVVAGKFHPSDDSIIVTSGHQHINFWRLFLDEVTAADQRNQRGRLLRDKHSGWFEVDPVPNFITSLTFAPNGDVITGDSDGNIRIWRHNKTDNSFAVNQSANSKLRQAHTKTVFALRMLANGMLVSGGGSELKMWDSSTGYQLVGTKAIPDKAGLIRTVAVNVDAAADGFVFVGTTGNCILRDALKGDGLVFVIEGHGDDLCTADCHPAEQKFITVGFDMTIIHWNAVKHRILWKTQMASPCTSIKYDVLGKLTVVGTNSGSIVLLDSANGSQVDVLDTGTAQAVTAIAFSPDGKLLAVGSQDTCIDVFTLDGLALQRNEGAGRLQGHTGAVINLDWSSDGRVLRSASSNYELLFWNVPKMSKIGGKQVKDIQWHSQSCTISYQTLGAWSNLERDEDINTSACSRSKEWLATGNNKGAVSLYRYPCSNERAECHVYKPCSGDVIVTQFTAADEFLIGAASSGPAIYQWSICADVHDNDDDTEQ